MSLGKLREAYVGFTQTDGEGTSGKVYRVYVLVLLTAVYLLNQCDTFCLVATNPSMAEEIGYGERRCVPTNYSALTEENHAQGYNGTASEYCTASICNRVNVTECEWRVMAAGIKYQLLAGPMDTMLFAISGVPMGLISELRDTNRKLWLSVCVIGWSAMTFVSGFARLYWHLALPRVLFGIFSSGCVPFSASLISDYFSPDVRGKAMGVFYFGVYIGYSMTFALLAAERALGWRAVYWVAGGPGLILGIVMIFTVREPTKGEQEVTIEGERNVSQGSNTCTKLRQALLLFLSPALLLLAIGGGIRNGAGLVFAYNLVIFMSYSHPEARVERWMSWIPLIFASTSSFVGGYISDRMMARKGVPGRLVVLVLCTVMAAPFAAGLVLAPSTATSFVCVMGMMLIGEMFLGVSTTAVIDMVPVTLRTSAVAIYFCFIQLIGGNTNLLVPPLRYSLGGLVPALGIAISGFYLVGAFFFSLSLVVTIWSKRNPKYHRGGTTDDDREIEVTDRKCSSSGIEADSKSSDTTMPLKSNISKQYEATEN